MSPPGSTLGPARKPDLGAAAPEMPLLREDLVVTPRPDGSGCQVQDNRHGESYDFGAVEHFMIEQLRRPYRVADVCAACSGHFGRRYTETEIADFLKLLEGWNLLEVPGAARAGKDESAGADTEGSELRGDVQLPNRWHLFDPAPLLDRLVRAAAPAGLLLWAVPVMMFVIGAAAVLFGPTEFFADLRIAEARFGLLGRLLLFALFMNLLSQVARGAVARSCGLGTPSFGLRLLFGLLPRFNIQILPTGGGLGRTQRLWLSSASIVVRLLTFGTAALLWATTRATGSSLATVGVELALVSIMGLAFVANPLWRGDGANVLSAWLGIPNIQQRARGVLLGLIRREPALIGRYTRHRFALALLGLASALLFAAVAGFILYIAFAYLEFHFSGAGVALFLALGAYVAITLRRQRAARQRRRVQAPDPAAPARRVALAPGAADAGRSDSLGEQQPWVRYGVAALLVGLLLLPYRYQTGGAAEVLPSARVTVAPEVDGIIEEVYYNGGEWVEAGTVLARMSDYRQKSELAILEAEIVAKKFEIEKYRTTPSPQEIELAEERVKTAKVQAHYSSELLKRQKQLFAQGFISRQELDDARNLAARDRQLRVESEASLKALLAQINPNQIAALVAEAERLDREADYYREQLRRTELKTAIAGRIVSKDLKFLRNSFLEGGKVFAEVEDTRTVLVRVDTPESDIGEVVLGAPLTLKLWVYPNREFRGTVVDIQPTTEQADFGRVVNVTSRLDNRDGSLMSGLTGQAKIEGNRTIVLLAFTRALARFFVIEVWSWLP